MTGVSTYLRYGYYTGNRRMLRISFAPGTEIAPPERRFLDSRFFGRPELGPMSLLLPAWASKDETSAAMRRFYDGPIED